MLKINKLKHNLIQVPFFSNQIALFNHCFRDGEIESLCS